MTYFIPILKASLCILFNIAVSLLAMLFKLDRMSEAIIIIAISIIPIIIIYYLVINSKSESDPIDINNRYYMSRLTHMNKHFLFNAVYSFGSVSLLILSGYIFYIKYSTNPINFYIGNIIELLIFKYMFWLLLSQLFAIIISLNLVYLRLSSTYIGWWILFPIHVVLYPLNVILDRIALNNHKSMRFIYFDGENRNSFMTTHYGTEIKEKTEQYTSWEEKKETKHISGTYDGSTVYLSYEDTSYSPVQKTRTSYEHHDYSVEGKQWSERGTCLSVTTRKILKYNVSGFHETGERKYKN